MKLRLALATTALAVAAAPFAAQPAQAMTCPPPVVSAVCFVYGTVCRDVIQHVDPDLHRLLCTVVA